MQGSSIIRKQVLGPDRPAIDPDLSVFINCPFDREFEPILDAIMVTIACCGFSPRSARESERISTPRIERMKGALFSSKYSIHDFTRCRGEGNEGFARFNMPLEFGMAMALRLIEEVLQVREDERHDWLLLVPGGHQYKKFVSDLAGYDPVEYDGTEVMAVRAVMEWLLSRREIPDQKKTLYPSTILYRLNEFKQAKKNLQTQWIGEIPWYALLEAATNIAG